MLDTLCGDRISKILKASNMINNLENLVILKICPQFCITKGRINRWWNFRKLCEAEFDPWTFLIPGSYISRAKKLLQTFTTTYCLMHCQTIWKKWFCWLSTEHLLGDQSLRISFINTKAKHKRRGQCTSQIPN